MDEKYIVIKILSEKPSINQRQLAKEIGVSLGKANSLIKDAIDNGLIESIS